jgi:hypothetical protein
VQQMTTDDSPVKPSWAEQDSRAFIDYGRYFMPERDEQIKIICARVESPFGSRPLLHSCAFGHLFC